MRSPPSSPGKLHRGDRKLCEDEIAISQTFIVIDPYRLRTKEEAERILEGIIEDLKRSEPIDPDIPVFYPGERTIATRGSIPRMEFRYTWCLEAIMALR